MKSDIYKKNAETENTFLPWFISIILLPLILYLLFNEGKLFIIDYFNLLIHEGGHGIFKIFGSKYLHALGGTFMQLLIPIIFVIYYFSHNKRIATQIFLIWLGQNLINVSIYAADARAQKLQLLGGKKVYHDWTYLLSEVGLLEYDTMIGQIFYFLAIATFIISILMPLLMRDYKTTNININL